MSEVKMKKIDLDETVKAYHLPNWQKMDELDRMKFLRKVAMEGGRDPRIATLAVDIIRKCDVRPRDYKGQADCILKWVQKNIYYVNEPGERLQDPIYTLRVGYGDCDDEAILLASFYESLRLPWRYVLSGKNRDSGKIERWIEGTKKKPIDFSHIYIVVGYPPFQPKTWLYAEPTLKGVDLGWDVVEYSKNNYPALPELAGAGEDISTFRKNVREKVKEHLKLTDEDIDLSPSTLAADIKKALTPRRIIVGLVTGAIVGGIIDYAAHHLGVARKRRTHYDNDQGESGTDDT